MNPQQIPPQMLEQIRRQMASGGPLPPGVIAVPQGQTPPPGAVPTGISAPLSPTQMQVQRPKSRETQNPIPDGDAGLQILRGLSDCPIPVESQKLNELMKKLITSKTIEDDVAEQALSKGLTVALRANKYCEKQLRTRTVCIFKEDDVLAKDHQELEDTTKELDELQKKIQACVEKGQKVLNHRWEYACKTYGLAPEKFSYRVDEEKGIIELVELRCTECTGATTIRKTRQETAELLLKADIKKETKDDGNRKTSSSNESPNVTAQGDGKANLEKPEVHGVADIPNADGSDGNPSAPVAE